LTGAAAIRHYSNVRRGLSLALAYCALCGGCGSTQDNGYLGTVDLGDDFVAPELQLDSDFFYCRIQPDVLTKHSCAGGGSGESGSCHDSRSALRLIATDATAPCDGDDVVIGAVPDQLQDNFEAISFSVQSNALDSPLYLRPLGRASHPRMIFDEGDPAADLIVEWIAGAAR
jgi:hypothetical protein